MRPLPPRRPRAPHLIARPLVRRRVARWGAALLLAAPLAGCESDPTAPQPATGRYVATIFRVSPTGAAPIDVIAGGGSLSIEVAPDGATTGQLSIPPNLNGGSPLVASMTGTSTWTGSTVRFTQQADTFVRDLTWTVAGNTLSVNDQSTGNARFTITLTRQ